nr:VWA domain-containing protein [uncultured Glaciecola sp.]
MIDWQAFHFIRPEWLIAIIPLLIIALLLTKIASKQSGWQGIVSSHLYQHLVVAKDKKSYKPPFYLVALVWVLACVAMAGPTWQKLPQPVYQVTTGKVVILDMSMSMRATDILPDRLSRAKFKVIDLLNSIEDGEVGLVVYAGDAFTISPLTSDVTNITTLIPSLRPEIMPIQGSEPLYAMEQAEQLLASAGYNKGEVYWVSDGIEFDDIEELQGHIEKSPYRYSILGVGTQTGAPIKMLDGSFMKDVRGNIVLPSLNSRYFAQVLGNTGGRYTPIQSDDSDIENMQFTPIILEPNQVSNDIIGQGDQWQDMGGILVLLILPFAAYAFRRGIMLVLLSTMLILPTDPSFADDEVLIKEKPEASEWVDNIFKNADQQGLEAFKNAEFDKASNTFTDQMWKGAAYYKNQNYEAALNTFASLPGAESAYNQGNALAHLGKLEKAIEKYDEALKERPGHTNAMANRKLVEDLLKQQEEQSEDGQPQDGEDQQSGESENSDKQSDEQDQGEQKSGDPQQGDQSEQQQESEQNPDESEDNEGKDSEKESDQQDGEGEADQAKDEEANEIEEGDSDENAEQKSNLQQQKPIEEMTPEEKEQMQRMQMLMNKIPDDPAFLLQRKMLLESQNRRSERFSKPNKKDW